MTIFNDNKKNTYAGVIVIVLAVLTAFSSHKALNKVSPLLFLGALIQTSAKSKDVQKIKREAVSNSIAIDRIRGELNESDFDLQRLSIKLEQLSKQRENITSNTDRIDSYTAKIDYITARIAVIESKLSRDRHDWIVRELESLTAQINSIKAQSHSDRDSNKVDYLAAKLQSLADNITNIESKIDNVAPIAPIEEPQLEYIADKITEIEARFNEYAPKSHLTILRNKLRRLSRQYHQAKLLPADTLLNTEQLEEQVKELCAAVDIACREQGSSALRFPLSDSYRQKKSPIKRIELVPVRPKSDRVGIFIDGANVSISAREVWDSRLAWQELLIRLRGESENCEAFYYASSSKKKGDFLLHLNRNGYKVISKPTTIRSDGTSKCNLDIEMANDIQASIESYDTFVIVSCDGDFLDTVRKLRSIGKRVELVSFKTRTHEPLIRNSDTYTDLTSLKAELRYQKDNPVIDVRS